MIIALSVIAAWIVLGFALFLYYSWRGWGDEGQVMPIESCIVTILFPVSAALYYLFLKLLKW